MNENYRIEIDELLNDLVDDQATERQETEFKRLAKHDPAIVDQLEAMRRQKQLLNALPIEFAPASLAEEVTSVLERKLILGDLPGDEQTIAGTSHLFLRRILTTAAMLLLPLGLLSFVVYEIMRPASVGPAVYVSTDQTLAQEDRSGSSLAIPAADAELPFDGVLTFSTDEQMAVSNYIKKRIFDQKLRSFPSRTPDAATYQITAAPEKIKTLINSLENVWSHCRDVTLSVADSSESYSIQIPQIHPEQIRALAVEDDRKMLNHMAGQYAVANENKKTLFAKEDLELQDIGLDESPRLTMPILTGTDDSPSEKTASTQAMIRLRIQVKRAVE
jgi:hypothetical protein